MLFGEGAVAGSVAAPIDSGPASECRPAEHLGIFLHRVRIRVTERNEPRMPQVPGRGVALHAFVG